ncbi:hypothetical protein [Yersinia intermedia]|uniref:Bacteriophage tail fiber protein n=1 Tax=Yersinia intermedia TaxID=631 RepID=A0A0T9N293_YERIN|nr:bacteriophage tail fiber protein [Yersinia intermedia]
MQKIGDIPNSRADNNGEFTDGNVAGGVPPTILPAEWFNTLQRELMSVLSAAEINADSEKFDQVAAAISKLISNEIEGSHFLQAANHLKEIKNAGPAAVAETLVNLGLGDAAKRSVGTGENQLPDMNFFTSGSNWQKLPSGKIIQYGIVSIPQAQSYVAFNLTFPIAFPNAASIVVGTVLGVSDFSLSGGDFFVAAALTNTGCKTMVCDRDMTSYVGGTLCYLTIGH